MHDNAGGSGNGSRARSAAHEQDRETGQPFGLIESLRWNGTLLRLDQHMTRLRNSAETLGFEFNEAKARSALHELVAGLAAGTPHKIRLQLDLSGAVSTEASPLHGEPAELQVVKLAAVRVDSRDELLQHKTTRRPLFDPAGARADSLGLADLLFCNEKGEVTQGARNNLFIRSGNRLSTPPAEAGLLPGVYRQDVLAKHPGGVLVRPLLLAELLQAEAVFLCNSVRGWRQVSVINETVELNPSR